MGTLKKAVIMAEKNNKEVINEKILFKEVGKRIRNIITLSNGELMLITDKKDGQLIKVKKI